VADDDLGGVDLGFVADIAAVAAAVDFHRRSSITGIALILARRSRIVGWAWDGGKR
jgi:hypothetical protein